jgi:hypothetical protein
MPAMEDLQAAVIAIVPHLTNLRQQLETEKASHAQTSADRDAAVTALTAANAMAEQLRQQLAAAMGA